MTKAEIWRLIGRIVQYYPGFAAKTEDEDEARVEAWHEVLRDVPFDRAMENLRRYVADKENRWPPHPGILAAGPDESALYHEQMIAAGKQALEEHIRRLANAVPPPADVSRKVREILANRCTN